MNPQTLPEYIKPGAVVHIEGSLHKFRIYATDNEFGYVHGAFFLRNNWALAAVSPERIIGPWIDLPDCSKLWPLLPPWIKYLAQDSDGDWRGHMHKPDIKDSGWDATAADISSWKYYITIPKDYAPIYSGDWKDSLVERPQ